jgi:lysyl-tRNA synthetase class 2
LGTTTDLARQAGEFASLTLAEKLRCRDRLVRRMRRFFRKRDYIEVETPLRVACPGIDPYIDALPAGEGRFLATSPELEMKKLLQSGLERIFQLTRAFRADESGDLHHPEFSILEWYSAGETYHDLMDRTEALVRECAAALEESGVPAVHPGWPNPFLRITVDESFASHAGWEPSSSFDADRFFRDLVDRVEPGLAAEGAVFLYDYPEPVGSLARRRPDDPLLCERFELYLDGIEICNGFTELTDANEQRLRFARDNGERERLGKAPYPVDTRFLAALESGLPSCAGNALGVDRLFLALTGSRRLGDVSLLSNASAPGRGR